MSNRKSPLYTVIAVLFSLIVLAGGAVKLYRGVSQLQGAGLESKVDELLAKSDKLSDEANQKSETVTPAFKELLGDFDRLGLVAFRSEKREACTKVSEQFAAVSEALRESSSLMEEATKLGTNEKLTSFLMTRSKSHQLLSKANTQNMDIVRTLLDESIVDVNEVVLKVQALAANRDADQKAANEAAEESNAILKRS